MDESNAGRFYALRMRLRGSLAHRRGNCGKQFSPLQEDAWLLLNEVEQMAKLLRQAERSLHPEGKSEYAYKVRHTVLMHFPSKQVAHTQREGPEAAGSGK